MNKSFQKMRKLVTFGSETSTSLVNNQGSRITPGLSDFSRKTNFSSADDHLSIYIPCGVGHTTKNSTNVFSACRKRRLKETGRGDWESPPL